MPNKLKERLMACLRICVMLIMMLELFFRFIIPAAKSPLGHFDTVNAVFRYFPGQIGVYTFGRLSEYRTRWRINNYGWNSPIDYQAAKSRPRIAVIGDSFVEALHVDLGKSYPYLLKQKFGEKYDIYTFGFAGAPLSEYLNISRYVNRYFDPDIIIFNVEYNDFDESILKYNKYYWKVFLTLSVEGSKVTENQPQPDKSYAEFVFWKRFLRSHSALARYLIFNLKSRMLYRGLVDKDFRGFYKKNIEFDIPPAQQKKEIVLATRYLVERIKSENTGKIVIFVMDAPREKIYSQDLRGKQPLWLHDLMRDICRENHLYFLDLTEAFENDYAQSGLKFNTDLDEHLNEHGHEVVATEVYDFLIKSL